MKRVSVSELKNRLSHYLRLVKSGEAIEVVEHRVPIATLRRVVPAGDDTAHLEKLVRDGIVTPARRDPSTLRLKPPIDCPVNIVDILLEERGRD